MRAELIVHEIMGTITTEERNKLLDRLRKNHSLNVAKFYEVKNGDRTAYITILLGGLHSGIPQSFMDGVVAKYVSGRMYNEYVDANLDNPWLRIIIEDINDLIN